MRAGGERLGGGPAGYASAVRAAREIIPGSLTRHPDQGPATGCQRVRHPRNIDEVPSAGPEGDAGAISRGRVAGSQFGSGARRVRRRDNSTLTGADIGGRTLPEPDRPV